jgi:DNA-directed RNA polymerase specialized sigma24 family protein
MTLDEEASPPPRIERARPARDPADAVFLALIARLGSEGEKPEVVYERLRGRLITYLRLHLPAEADDLADLTLDRMARRIHEGTAVQSIYSYALGVARMLLHESRARHSREQQSILEQAPLLEQSPPEEEESEVVLSALQGCLQHLGQAAADLILAYYGGEGSERIGKRRRLAEELGLSSNALRNRALRLREALERCTRQKLGWRDGSQRFGTIEDGDEGRGS